MAKKLKMTFVTGEVVYAKLMEKEAPETVKKICEILPMDVDMLHGRYAGPAMFWNTPFGAEIEPENLVERKWVGMMTLTLGNSNHPQHANHIFYSYRRPICGSNKEIYWAQVEDAYFPVLENCGERVWTHCPEKVRFEIVEE